MFLQTVAIDLSLSGLNCILPNSFLEFLISTASKQGFIWTQGLCSETFRMGLNLILLVSLEEIRIHTTHTHIHTTERETGREKDRRGPPHKGNVMRGHSEKVFLIWKPKRGF